jgi:hypothetical protein
LDLAENYEPTSADKESSIKKRYKQKDGKLDASISKQTSDQGKEDIRQEVYSVL